MITFLKTPMKRIISSTLFLSVFISAGIAVSAAPSAPKERAPQTWGALLIHVGKNGVARELKAPLCRKLGFNSDSVKTKALRLKAAVSPDGLDRAIYVDDHLRSDGKPSRFAVIARNRTTEIDGQTHVEALFAYLDSAGRLRGAVKTKGPARQVKQTAIDIHDAALQSEIDQEIDFYLNKIKFKDLGK